MGDGNVHLGFNILVSVDGCVMENLKIKVSTAQESKEAQELFFELGYVWFYNMGRKIENVTGVIKASSDGTMCAGDVFKTNHKEITLQQLRDKVVLKRNKITDATHTGKSGSEYYKGCNCFYFWNGMKWTESTIDYIGNDLKPIEKEMKEYLEKQEDGTYKLVMRGECGQKGDIEVPDGAVVAVEFIGGRGEYLAFYKQGADCVLINYPEDNEWLTTGWESNSDFLNVVDKHGRLLWQRSEGKAVSVEGESKHSHYKKDVSDLEFIDVYRVLKLFNVTDPCLQHAIKKLLCSGQRGVKDSDKDIQEAIDSLQRYQDMRVEDGEKA